VFCAKGAELLPVGEALAKESRARGVDVLADVGGHVHAPAHADQQGVERAAALVLERGGQQAVPDVLVGHAAHGNELAPVRGHRHFLAQRRLDVRIQVRDEDLAEV